MILNFLGKCALHETDYFVAKCFRVHREEARRLLASHYRETPEVAEFKNVSGEANI
jgi:hypothetical protein